MKAPIVNAVEVEALQAQSGEAAPTGRRASAVTILDMETEEEEPTEVRYNAKCLNFHA